MKNLPDHKSDHQLRVEEFMRRAKQEVPDHPITPDPKTRVLRAKLILEEALETIWKGLGVNLTLKVGDGYEDVEMKALDFEVLKPYDPIETADGCADIKVVTTGTLTACGIADEALQEEVDASNLDKFELPICPQCSGEMKHTAGGLYVCEKHQATLFGPYRREDGKWVKGPDWEAPNIERAIYENVSRHDAQCEEVGLESADDFIAQQTSNLGSGRKGCGKCKTPIGENVTKLFDGKYVFHCPNCYTPIHSVGDTVDLL